MMLVTTFAVNSTMARQDRVKHIVEEVTLRLQKIFIAASVYEQ